MQDIKHVWFDLDGTLTVHTPEFDDAHNNLRYAAYSEVVKRPISVELISEFEDLYKKYGSNSAVFRSLGLPSDYWMKHYDTLDQNLYYEPVPDIYETLEKLKAIVSISLFTNVKLANARQTLKVIGIDQALFSYILTGDDIQERKPALDGFHEMIRLSKCAPEQILYVGDRVDVDIKPAHELGIKTCLVWSSSNEADVSVLNFPQLLTILSN